MLSGGRYANSEALNSVSQDLLLVTQEVSRVEGNPKKSAVKGA